MAKDGAFLFMIKIMVNLTTGIITVNTLHLFHMTFTNLFE